MRLRARACPVCGDPKNHTVHAQSNVDPAKLNGFAFASRKLPELMHHRLLHCGTCDAIYASPAPPSHHLASAYEEALFDSAEEARYASLTYARQLPGLGLPDKRGALDIGTGDGAFLERLLEHGFSAVQGVEPSTAPIQAAKPATRKLIRHGMFKASAFKPRSLSLVTCFQTLEHLNDPKGVARAARSLLKPGGAFFAVCHSHRALSAKILGKRSPIYDLEHLQLLSPRSVARLLQETGFERIRVLAVNNRYPLHYWVKVFPFPGPIKQALLSTLRALGLGQLSLPLPAGNLVAIGYKPKR